jgi:hypothetical protein
MREEVLTRQRFIWKDWTLTTVRASSKSFAWSSADGVGVAMRGFVCV